MKNVRIKAGDVAVVTKYDAFDRILTIGKHRIRTNEFVKYYSLNEIYDCDSNFDLMMMNEEFSNMVNIINVSDDEIALKYVNGNFDSLLMSGKYFHFLGMANFRFKIVDLNKIEIDSDISISLYSNKDLAKYIRVFKVESYELGLLIIDGNFVKQLSHGMYYFWNNATTIQVLKVDVRQLLMEISGQEILTIDKAALRLNIVAQYRVVDVEKAVLHSNNYSKQLYAIFQLAFREYVGRFTLDELLANKDSVSEYIMASIKNQIANLGVEIDYVGIKDVILPGEVKEIMNQVLIAQKRAQANTISRREETASTRSLLNTAKLMEDNAMLFKLKEMEYIEKIADRVGEITVSGNGHVIDQLSSIFSVK